MYETEASKSGLQTSNRLPIYIPGEEGKTSGTLAVRDRTLDRSKKKEQIARQKVGQALKRRE
jgi:hypothetical protein